LIEVTNNSRKAERKYMKKPENLKINDMFRVIEGDSYFNVGEIIKLKEDDGTGRPYFWKEDKSDYYCIRFSSLEPYAKTARDAQVGDVVADKIGNEYMVLERGKRTVLLSGKNDFTKTGDTYTFGQLDRYFTLKAEPEVDDKTAEAIKLLKEAGYKISK